MLNVSFWELMVIMVIAFLVLGPQRLMRVAYHGGRWFSRLRSYLAEMKQEIERSVELEDNKRRSEDGQHDK